MNKTQLAIKNGRTVYTNNVYGSTSYNSNLLKLSSNKKLGKFISKVGTKINICTAYH